METQKKTAVSSFLLNFHFNNGGDKRKPFLFQEALNDIYHHQMVSTFKSQKLVCHENCPIIAQNR